MIAHKRRKPKIQGFFTVKMSWNQKLDQRFASKSNRVSKYYNNSSIKTPAILKSQTAKIKFDCMEIGPQKTKKKSHSTETN